MGFLKAAPAQASSLSRLVLISKIHICFLKKQKQKTGQSLLSATLSFLITTCPSYNFDLTHTGQTQGFQVDCSWGLTVGQEIAGESSTLKNDLQHYAWHMVNVQMYLWNE